MDKKVIFIAGGALVVGAGVGFGIGYSVAKKKYEAIAQQEIDAVAESYRIAAIPKPNLEDLMAHNPKLDNPVVITTPESIISENGYIQESHETDTAKFQRHYGRVPTTIELAVMASGVDVENVRAVSPEDLEDNLVIANEANIFEDPETVDPGEGTDPENPRSPDRPYVIKAEQWYTNELDYDQIVLTYWADDDVLVNVDNRIITEPDDVVGIANLHGRWGFLSEDPDIVYVRNEARQADYEIHKDERNWSEVVHKADPEAKSGVPRRMRSNDE